MPHFKVYIFKPFVESKPRLTQELELIGGYISWQDYSYEVVEAARPCKSSAGVWVENHGRYIGGFHELLKYFDKEGLLLI